MKKRTAQKLKFAVYGMGIFIGILLVVGIVIYSMNGRDYHDQIHKVVGTMKLEGIVDYRDIDNNLSLTFSFLDKNLIPYKRFISNNAPINIFMVSHDFLNEFHIIPKFDKFTGVFTVNEHVDLKGKNYQLYIEAYPKNGQKTLFVYPLIINKNETRNIPLIVDKGVNDFNGTYRARFYLPKDLGIGREQEISMRIFEKIGELTAFQSMNGEYAYMWIVSSDGSVFLAPKLAARSKLTWQLNFPKTGVYKAFVKTKLKNKIQTFKHTFNVTDKNIMNDDAPLMRAQ